MGSSEKKKMPLDSTQRPLKIPQKFTIYPERNDVFDVFERMMSSLIISKPADPIKYMIDWLQNDTERKIKASIVGPAGAGKRMLANHIAEQTGAIRIGQMEVVSDPYDEDIQQLRCMITNNEEIPVDMWTQPIIKRLSKPDCTRRGWVLEGFPKTRSQAIKFQEIGLTADYVILLDAPNTVLTAREHGKRLDPETNECYHPLFNWTDDEEILQRLRDPPHKADVIKEADFFRRNKQALIDLHSNRYREINADQPLDDIKAKVLSYISQRPISLARRTARTILIGPRGSGKATLAAKLAAKYNLVIVNVNELIEREKLSGSRLARRIKEYQGSDDPLPNDLLVQILNTRLEDEDCVTRGWIIFGLPLKNGPDLLGAFLAGSQVPNRIFVLDIPTDSSIERICHRHTDPETGICYHQLYDPAPTTEISLRMVQRKEDEVDVVRAQIDEYLTNLPEYLEHAADFGALRINADQDAYTVFELAESKIINPLPSEFNIDQD